MCNSISLRTIDESTEGVKFSIKVDNECEFDLEDCFNESSFEIKEIKERIQAGDTWAWCDVTVIAEYNDWSGKAYLGACSYKSEEEFRNCEYFSDMKAEALDELNNNIRKVAERLPVKL